MTLQGKALVVFHTGVGVVLEWAGDEQVAEFLSAEIDRGRPFTLESAGIDSVGVWPDADALFVGSLRIVVGEMRAVMGVPLATISCDFFDVHPITPDEFRRWCEGHWPWTETFAMKGEGDDSASEERPGAGDGG